MNDELRAYVDLLTEEKMSRGLSPDEARRAALIEAGGVEQVKEAIRDVSPRRFVDRLRQDVGYGLRLFRRSPGLNLAVVLALALGIGATSATFSVVDGVLLRPLDYASADELVVVMHRRTNPVAPANFLDWQRHGTAFASMGAAEYWTPTLGSATESEKLFALHVSDEMLPMLGIAPAMGRFPLAGDAGASEAVIADSLWRRVFGGDPAALGRTIVLDGRPYAIAGIMPPRFKFAPFWATRAELWAPLVLGPRATSRGGNSLRVFARLAPGVSLDQARASMAALTTELEARYPGTNRNVAVTPLKDVVVGDARHAIVVLFAAVGLVLLVACANVAHLLLSRAASREKEVAVRAALGAGRLRMIRQFLTESLLLSAAGGAAGVLLADGMISIFKQLGAASIPRVQSIQLDARVVAFAMLLSILTTLAFGLVPALRLSRPNLTGALRDAERGSSTGRRGRRLGRLLIASEIALAVTLLVGASLLIRSFTALRAVDPGFVPDHLATFVVSVTGSAEGAPGRRLGFYQDLLDRVRAIPGVQSASAINHVPLAGDLWGFPFRVEGRPEPAPGEVPTAAYRVVLPRYFETMRLPLVAGRDFTDADRLGAPDVVIVSQYLADTYFPGENALGKRIRVSHSAGWQTIVGITRHVVRSDWQDHPEEEAYLPLLQVVQYHNDASPAAGYLSYVVRTSGEPSAVIPALRRTVRELSTTAPVSDVFVMTDVIHEATMGARFVLTLLGVFAAIAWLLAAVGIYGVMSHSVATRRHEIGIRMTLGATRARIVGHVLGEGMTVTAIGVIAGAAGALLFGGALSSMLFGITPRDVPAFVWAVTALVAAAAVACYLPARRASAIDPQTELR
jgi:putative ABC transport system permease protein